MADPQTSAVVTCEWLKQQLAQANNNLCVLDVSWSLSESGLPDYLSAHIPGAQFYDHNKHIKPTYYLPRNLPEPASFQEYVQSLGLNQHNHLVVYDQGDITPAARAWWVFRAYGHPRVSVLEGGLGRWIKEGNKTASGQEGSPQPGDFQVVILHHLIKSFDDVREEVDKQATQIVDSRIECHFTGSAQEPNPRTIAALKSQGLPPPQTLCKGHMPGAINMEPSTVFDAELGAIRTPEQIKKNFENAGVDLTKPFISTCYNATKACLIALGAAMLGNNDVSIYLGSWTEYGQRVNQADCVISAS